MIYLKVLLIKIAWCVPGLPHRWSKRLHSQYRVMQEIVDVLRTFNSMPKGGKK